MMYPKTRTVLDIGGQDTKGIHLDSAVADEAILPAYSNLKHPAESGRHSRQQDTSFLVTSCINSRS
jgi:hypothetical protein